MAKPTADPEDLLRKVTVDLEAAHGDVPAHGVAKAGIGARGDVVTHVKCGHCGREMPPHERAYANGVDLCHTGTMPPGAYPPDCYRLVTIYQHAANGSCCPELASASGLARRMADKAGHAALLRAAAETLKDRNLPGDACLRTTLQCAADVFPWTYGVMPPEVDDVMTGLVRTADEIIQQREGASDV